jgi:asparagine synthase (glutamine-hydrolysing)
MRGMFAFAIWDERHKRLFVARDRLGVKPLFYTIAGGRLAFGSELKVLLELPEVKRELNLDSVNYLFSSLTTPIDESIVKGIHKLRPGHTLSASPVAGVRIRQYWDLEFDPDYGKTEEYFVERLRDLLEESVRLRMVADVPLGAFLSGGIDSSAVVATMARLSPAPVKTFSIGFEDPEYNELEHARRVAEQFGTDHQELILEPNVLDVIDDLAWYLDEPFGDSSAIPTYMVSKLASDSVKVVLSGDGGDELFGGYDRYLVEQRERRFAMIPRPLRQLAGLLGDAMPAGMKGRNFLRHLSCQGADRYIDCNVLIRASDKPALFLPDAYSAMDGQDPLGPWRRLLQHQSTDWLSPLQYFDTKYYLPNDILTKVDRMSMAHSIEAREPLLDHKLVEFAATIPASLKLRGKTTKYIFKRAMEGILPADILHRPKRGFAIPLGRWFRGQLGPYVRDLLLSPGSLQRGIFNPAYIQHLIDLNDRGRPMDLQLWTLITFELWCRRFMDRGQNLERTPASTSPRFGVRPQTAAAS